MTTFGQRLLWARQLRNLTQGEVAKLSGMDQTSIAYYETGQRGTTERFLSGETPQKLADALSVNAEWLRRGVGAPTQASNSTLSFSEISSITGADIGVLFDESDPATKALVAILLLPKLRSETVHKGISHALTIARATAASEIEKHR